MRAAEGAAVWLCASSRSSAASIRVRRSSIPCGQALLDALRGARALDERLEAVEPVLDSLEPLRDAPHPAREPFQIGRGGQVQGPHRSFLGTHRALAGLKCGRQRPADHLVLQQLLGELADRLFALAGHSDSEALLIVHCAALYRGMCMGAGHRPV